MKKTFSFCIIAGALLSYSCKGNQNKTEAEIHQSSASDSVKNEYTCPMHPEIISDKPGQCSICGMDLAIKS